VTLRLPTPDLAAAPVAYLAVGGVPGTASDDTSAGGSTRLAYRLQGGQPQTISVPVDLRTPDGDPLVLRRAGRHRLRVRLFAADAGVAVRVERAG
jgi:hypothetical protein